jgi:hypothetical protein
VPGTWSYDPADLASTEKDTIRLEIGDTDSNNWLLSDEEINYAISQERNFWAAAARCAEMAASALLRKADPKLGRSMQVIYSKAAEQYWNRARMLRSKAMGSVAPYVGGGTVADKQSIDQDSSLVAPQFTKTMMQNPWVGGYTTDSVSDTSEDDVGTYPSEEFI